MQEKIQDRTKALAYRHHPGKMKIVKGAFAMVMDVDAAGRNGDVRRSQPAGDYRRTYLAEEIGNRKEFSSFYIRTKLFFIMPLKLGLTLHALHRINVS